MQDHDPLWYDRAEPEEEWGLLLTSAALLFVSAVSLYSLPYRLCRTLDRFIRRAFRTAPGPESL